jgi:hypothetical protein
VLAFMSIVACVLYLAPLAAIVAVLRREGDDALDLACAIGVAFAADLVGGFLLTYLFTVEVTAFVRTGLLLAAAGVIAARRARAGGRPLNPLGALSRGDLAALAIAAGIAFAISMYVSSRNWVWDREWHVPFTGSLRAQQMPFRNVYDPTVPIRYHLVGDLAASSLQALSFVTISASRALSLAHDLQSAVLAAMAALVFRAFCRWPPANAALAALVPLLAGPIAFASKGLSPALGAFEGESDFNNATLSFRPHCMVACVVLVAAFAVVLRLARDRGRRAAPGLGHLLPLVPLVALGSISDESSTLLLGIGLSVAWLGWPEILGATRLRGVVLLGALGVTALLANLFLAGTIAPGGPIQHASLVAPRLPRIAAPGWPLAGDMGAVWVLLLDQGEVIIPGIAVLVAVAAGLRRGTDDELSIPAVLALTVGALGLAMFLSFEVNGRTFEGHRFSTAGRVLVPTLAILALSRVRRSWAVAAILVPVVAGVISTLAFLIYRLPEKKDIIMSEGQYDVDCRADYGARLGEPIVANYVDQPLWFQPFWYEYTGCRPVFTAGRDGPRDVVLCGYPKIGPEGYAKMNAFFFPPNTPALVSCSTMPQLSTPLCKKVQGVATCAPQGSRGVTCEVPAASRASLLTP